MKPVLVPAEPAHLGALLHLQAVASEAYDRFVYGDQSVAHEFQSALLAADAGEFSVSCSTVAVDDEGTVLGFAAHLAAKDVRRCRLRAARQLQRQSLLSAWPEVAKRMSAASSALFNVDDGDYYLSRIAVIPEARGRGVGGLLMERFLAAARTQSASRAVLDVATENESARLFYAALGFTEAAEVSVSAGGSSLCNTQMVLSL